ncbi:DNA ligase [Streptomyces sp. NBC_01744]|uniref:ATP-dependent DNA ligase n=1 Tax=Streptomyces sp. NBC_01744 TaxID=2975927 RepID=UPI003D9A993C|nr:DNA ligase [Streptomyces sp. NBC_01744]
MEFPIKVALAQAVPTLPDGPGWWYEPKFDGHRTILRRTDDTVILYARSGRVVTPYWMDLAVAGMELRPGTVLDGEAVIWREGRLDFGAAQSRAASSVTRARALATRHPASYACWDVLQHPDPEIGDCRSLPYVERRAYLLELLADAGPPIQAVPATDDRSVALHWYETLSTQGIEGVLAKRGSASYPSGRRGWMKVRHADTEDALVVGFTGPRLRPHRLALAVGDEGGPVRLSARLESVLAGHIGAALSDAAVVGDRRTQGETYSRIETDLVVEVLAGSGRHGTLTVVRMR